MVFLSSGIAAAPPLRANYFLPWDIDSSFAPALAKYDLLVLDMELQHKNPALLQTLRALNPDIIIYAYMTCEEINTGAGGNPEYLLRYNLFNGIADEWWLRDADGEHIVFWPGTWMLNVSSQCPLVGGKQWNSYFADFICQNVLSTGLWDGFYIDNCWYECSWLDDELDIDNNGVADDPDWADAQWRLGMQTMMTAMRGQQPGALLMGNSGYAYPEYLNGVLIETFPHWGGWPWLMQQYFAMTGSAVPPRYSVINCNTRNTGDGTDYQEMRFGLTSALLGDGFYSYDFGDTNHSQVWWYDEFDVDLGEAMKPAVCLNDSREIYEDFETGSTDWEMNNWDGMSTQITTDAISGTYSLEADTLASTEEWNEFLYTPLYFSLPANAGIRVVFDYKVTARQANCQFYTLARSVAGGIPADCGFRWFGDEAVLGQVYTQDHVFTTHDFNDYYLIWGTTNQGVVVLDNLAVYSDENLLYERAFTQGRVLCNPSTHTQVINLPHTYRCVAGSQDPVHNHGGLVDTVVLSPQDGIVLVKDLLAFYDLNDDGVVDSQDLGRLLSHVGSVYPAADFNEDGLVDLADARELIGYITSG